MKKIDLFPTPLVKFNLENSDKLNSGLVDYVKTMKDDTVDGKKQPYSMVGGKHTDFSLFLDWELGKRKDKFVEEFYTKICDLILEYGQKYIDEHFKDTHGPGTRITPWAMIYGPNDYSKVHNHPGIDLAIVYYPKVPKTSGTNGNIEFIDPRPCSTWDFNNNNKTSQSFKPEEGTGFIFPAWLQHGTTPHREDDERICIAINVKFHRSP